MLVSNVTLNNSYKPIKNQNKLPFLGYDAYSIPIDIASFSWQNPKEYTVSDKFKLLKEYNLDTPSALKYSLVSDEDFSNILEGIRLYPDREYALSTKDAAFSLDCSKDRILSLIDSTVSMQFSDGYGYYSKSHLTSKDRSSINRTKYLDSYKDSQMLQIVDKSKLNPNYDIRNEYVEKRAYKDLFRFSSDRNIQVKDSLDDLIINYKYSKKNRRNSDTTRYTINDRQYNVHVKDNLKVYINSKGRKTQYIDFSKMIEFDNDKKKAAFVNALKNIPPHVLLTINTDFSKIKNTGNKSYYYNGAIGINMFSSETMKNSLIDNLIEHLIYKNGLLEDKELNSIFDKELEKYSKWAKSDHAYRNSITDENNFLKPSETKEMKLVNITKMICDMIWLEDYEENKNGEEKMRILLNFFPQTTAHILSLFEMNNI